MNNGIKIYFIRHGKLDLPYEDHLEMPYEILDNLATGRLDPSIAKGGKKLFLEAVKKLPLKDLDVIYFNNSNFQSKRSKESAFLIGKILKEKYNKKVPILGNPNLKEIDFSLKDILPKEKFLRQGMPAVRTALYNAIINQGPVEEIDRIYQRTENIFRSLKKHQNKNQTVILVSHDFYMRTIEVYLQKSKDYRKVTISDLEKTTLNTYFKGFAISYDLKLFKRF
ncbi:MAG: phosphoglycerate mutase family protein [Patescibacteria group bacterium]|nr:phosphoglycerate mutase family protein [Patescibacteria group bacterium]